MWVTVLKGSSRSSQPSSGFGSRVSGLGSTWLPNYKLPTSERWVKRGGREAAAFLEESRV